MYLFDSTNMFSVTTVDMMEHIAILMERRVYHRASSRDEPRLDNITSINAHIFKPTPHVYVHRHMLPRCIPHLHTHATPDIENKHTDTPIHTHMHTHVHARTRK